MSLAQRLQDTLDRFEGATTGVLSTSVISRSQALLMAATSSIFDRDIIQGMSVRFLRLAMETLSLLVTEPVLEAVSLEEDNHFIFILPIDSEYYVVTVTDKSEFSGVRLSNMEKLVQQLNRAINQ